MKKLPTGKLESVLKVYDLSPGTNEIVGISRVLLSFITRTNDDIRLRKFLRIQLKSTTWRFTKDFFHSILGFTNKKNSWGTCISEKPFFIKGIDGTQSKRESVAGSFLKGSSSREAILYITASDGPPVRNLSWKTH